VTCSAAATRGKEMSLSLLRAPGVRGSCCGGRIRQANGLLDNRYFVQYFLPFLLSFFFFFFFLILGLGLRMGLSGIRGAVREDLGVLKCGFER
jgi:hypothetical protein